MKPPLEYGDNFPVPPGFWNPAEPWRFPKHEVIVRRRGLWGYALPWFTLGLGLTLGILWMSWRVDVEGKPPAAVNPEALRPASEPAPAGPVTAPQPHRRPTGSRARSEVA